MQSSHMDFIQVQLECGNPDGGKTVFVTWIPKDLKTHPGSVLTEKESGEAWKVARQYEQTMQGNTAYDTWKIA